MIRPERKLNIVATNEFANQRLFATPAVDGDAWGIRTENGLYRIENGANLWKKFGNNDAPARTHRRFND